MTSQNDPPVWSIIQHSTERIPSVTLTQTLRVAIVPTARELHNAPHPGTRKLLPTIVQSLQGTTPVPSTRGVSCMPTVWALGIVYRQKRKIRVFGLFQHLIFFFAYFWAAYLEAGKKPKKFGPENIRPREVETTEATS